MPLSTAGWENVDEVKNPELHTSSRVPLAPGSTGTGLKASSCELAPPEPDEWIIHRSAEPDVVPFDVMTGAPDPKPNVLPEFVVVPTSGKDNTPFVSVRWNTLRAPPPPVWAK